MNRRHFLGHTAGAVAAGATLPSAAFGAARPSGRDGPVRPGQVGAFACAQMLAGSACQALCALVAGEWPQVELADFTATTVWTLLYMAVFGSVIAVGVVFNTARVALSERSRDLSTLRVLGFTRAEVGSTARWRDIGDAVRTSGLAAVSANGVLGDPTGATEEEGRRIFGMLVEQLCAAVDRWRDTLER